MSFDCLQTVPFVQHLGREVVHPVALPGVMAISVWLRYALLYNMEPQLQKARVATLTLR